jgi:hypothetical protein
MQDLKDLAHQFNRAVQILARTVNLTESASMEIADIYPAWTVSHAYKAGDIVKYGTNQDGETQLYSVIQAHTSQTDWLPDASPSLFRAIGFTDSGIPIWTQPRGASDAYDVGDKVSHNSKIWVSIVAANGWEPGVYGWTEAA